MILALPLPPHTPLLELSIFSRRTSTSWSSEELCYALLGRCQLKDQEASLSLLWAQPWWEGTEQMLAQL